MILKTELISKIPRYYCDKCSKCSSHISLNFTEFKNRGCCYYFPKFNLVDLQKMVSLPGGKDTLNLILNNKGTVIYNYHIVTHGIFEKEKYELFINSKLLLSDEEYNILNSDEFIDKSLFFKTCPFVENNKGCTIPVEFRSPVCNFFICNEIKSEINNLDLIKTYEKEALNYWKYYTWEDENLIHLLKENNTNLIKDWNKSLSLLESTNISYYDFPMLTDFSSNNPQLVLENI